MLEDAKIQDVKLFVFFEVALVQRTQGKLLGFEILVLGCFAFQEHLDTPKPSRSTKST